ncbi:MAG: LuxR C-terminal-related transcriptional regulator [Burkholderiaceae bacterium]
MTRPMTPGALAHPELLRGSDLSAALDFVSDLTDTIDDADAFARCGVQQLPRLAASELTTLSVCDLRGGRRHVIGFPSGAIGAGARASFDRHFNTHPLVRYHGLEGGCNVRRISDSVPFAAFRETALYHEYYRSVGIDHAVALPVHVGDGWLVSFVLNRRGSDFCEREVALLDQVRRAVAGLFRRTGLLERTRNAWRLDHGASAASKSAPPSLTGREHEVMRWVAAGKTDRDIADILAISPRTVHKHLQNVYARLGVETRTAAVMRALPPGFAPRTPQAPQHDSDF